MLIDQFLQERIETLCAQIAEEVVYLYDPAFRVEELANHYLPLVEAMKKLKESCLQWRASKKRGVPGIETAYYYIHPLSALAVRLEWYRNSNAKTVWNRLYCLLRDSDMDPNAFEKAYKIAYDKRKAGQ